MPDCGMFSQPARPPENDRRVSAVNVSSQRCLCPVPLTALEHFNVVSRDQLIKSALTLLVVAGEMAIARLNTHVVAGIDKLIDRARTAWTHHRQDVLPSMGKRLESKQLHENQSTD